MTSTATLHAVSQQWATRPDDERFLTLDELAQKVNTRREESWTLTTRANQLRAQVADDGLRLTAYDRTAGIERSVKPTHWSFGQLASYAQAPASYLRKLPTELAAINLQWGLENAPIREDALVYGATNGDSYLRAMTSTSYGRIYDAQVVKAVQRVNEAGNWQVPAASYATTNPRRATTLYASDRDVFLFLVDPNHPIEVNGDTLFRGFYAWNSEVGAQTFGLTTFLYRYVCDNRIIWGATDVQELRIRHTGGAPDRFAYEGQRYLSRYANESAAAIAGPIERAQAFELDRADNQDGGGWAGWLAKRGFTKSEAEAGIKAANTEEGGARSLWDIVNGITASARSIQHTDARVDLETKAGKLMEVVRKA